MSMCGLHPTELERQAGNDEGREKERQEPLASAPEGDHFAVGGIERLRPARVSAIADLDGVTSRFDWRLERSVHFNRPDAFTVNQDIVRAATDLHSD
jgi:hypothetical protein